MTTFPPPGSTLADLRAKVEALQGKWQRSVERDPDGKLSGYDRAHVAALDDVLDLIDGDSEMMGDHDPLCRQQHWKGGDCFDCRLIAKVRADEREQTAQAIQTQGESWVAEGARYRGYAEGSSVPGSHQTAALVLNQCGTSLMAWAREHRKTRRVEAGKETSVQPDAIGPDAHADEVST